MKSVFIPRTVVLTGATRGLGRALVGEFIRAGHTVCGSARSVEGIHQLRQTYGPRHRFDVVDVADDAAVKQWADEVVAAHGPPDLLLNNAAVINRNAPLWRLDASEVAQVINTNVLGVIHATRHFLPFMIRQARGVVVNWSSGWGRSTAPEVAPYCASKWAIEGLSQALSQELPAGLAVVALNPGVIHTEMLVSCLGSAAQAYPSPEAWARIAAPYLLSLDGRDNGRALTVPGVPT